MRITEVRMDRVRAFRFPETWRDGQRSGINNVVIRLATDEGSKAGRGEQQLRGSVE